jgi:hypothetical protein
MRAVIDALTEVLPLVVLAVAAGRLVGTVDAEVADHQ